MEHDIEIIYPVVDQVGTRGGEAWLISAPSSAVLIDTGSPFYSHKLVEEINIRLHGLRLTDILVTHSHYDHAGGLAVVKAAFPDASIHASAHAADILNRENALKMRREPHCGESGGRGFLRFRRRRWQLSHRSYRVRRR